ncbi:helicase family member protein [Theileria equi strain WA]|uniref:Helicase family member protein n=1 Tax=Theileria equi strain WA TaxID=1537102 RepID=L0B0Q4_THEEQ|nr:helicase family member protein [Theileria equi strain WA]AFZ80724.1 helicase family member protein [Theileria equi strain WA]|eukprot:XP_004830390.1 helicase family member protein [Theileria equi strain WA]
MNLNVREIDSETLEQKTCRQFEESYCIQLILNKLKRKIDQNDRRYEKFYSKLQKIVDSNRTLALGESIGDSQEYKLLGKSKIQVGDEVLELSDDDSDDESANTHLSTIENIVKIANIDAVELADDIYIPLDKYNKLYDHQKKGLKWLVGLHKRNHGGILADDMGLGKTVTVLSLFSALTFSSHGKEPMRILVVCTITLINQWKEEISRWVPDIEFRVFHTSHGLINDKKIDRHTIVITSYDTLRINIEYFNMCDWSYVVLDEGQKIRNPDSAITLAVKTLGTPHRLLMSGSPIQNNLVEFWSLLDFVAPGHLGTLPLFIEQFVDPITQSQDKSNSSVAYNCAIRLRSLIVPFIQRNVKSNFIKSINLPKKSEHVLLCNLTATQHYIYVRMLRTLSIDELSSKQRNEELYRRYKNRYLMLLSILRKICNHPDLVLSERPKDFGKAERSGKLSVTLEIVSKWESEGHKMLLFSQTIQMLNIIQAALESRYTAERICRMDGTVSLKKREKVLSDFENCGEKFILLLTTRVGGVGLNLTFADRILIYDPDWNPMTDSQARERCYRIGQTKDVLIYRLITAHTVEEKIYHRQIYKYYLSERILSDPRVVNFRFLPSSDLLQIPPEPPSKDGLSRKYLSKVNRLLKNREFELELRQLNNSKDMFQNYEDVKESADNPLLQSIFEHHNVEGIIKHDEIENTKLSKIEDTSSRIADNAIRLLKKSLNERRAYDISIPTWTGKSGMAAAPVLGRFSQNSHHILNNLKNMKRKLTLSSQGEDEIAQDILDYFKHRKNQSAQTGEVIQHFGPIIPESQSSIFKLLLKRICNLVKVEGGPNYWKLKSEFVLNNENDRTSKPKPSVVQGI